MKPSRLICLATLSICSATWAGEASPAAEPAVEMTLEKQYLNIPVVWKEQDGKPHRAMSLTVDGNLLGKFSFALGEDKPDWWAFFDVARFKGQKMVVNIDPPPKDWSIISQDDAIKGAEDLYREKYRPQFHFTSRRGWLNDPNGLVYYDGEWHMYYQHNPVGTAWGNMTWGHAVSKDLVHWKELPTVLFPNRTGDCFSGAGFIDHENLLGRKTGEEDVLVMFYLRTNSGLCLAYSNDRGRTLTDYEGNPVLTNPGARIDTPRPFWHEPTGRWIAPIYDHFKDKQGKNLRAVGFYSSKDLKQWTYESRVEQDKWGDELCGCADFFQLPVDGDPDNQKWVLVLIDNSYIVGTFDGHKFHTLAGKPARTADRVRSLVVGGNFYATQTWHDAPQGRRVQITWMRDNGAGARFPGMPFNQQMTIPVELTLHSTDEGPRMRMNPVKELETLRVKTHRWTDLTLKAGENPLAGIQGNLFDVEVEFEPAANTQTTFDLRGHKVVYDAQAQMLSSGGLRTPLKPDNGVIHLRILLDRTCVEVFGNHGRVYLPLCILPEDDRPLNASCREGQVKVRFLRVHELKSAWEQSDSATSPPEGENGGQSCANHCPSHHGHRRKTGAGDDDVAVDRTPSRPILEPPNGGPVPAGRKPISCQLSATLDEPALAQLHTNKQPLFAFCHDTHDAEKRNMEEQADMLKQLGYAGCGHLWLNNVEPRIQALDKAGLRLFQIYMQLDLQKDSPIDEAELTKILPLLKHHETQLALLITGAKPSDASFDDKAMLLINRIADHAEQNNLTVVLYPHTNDWLEKCSDAVRIAEKINRPGLVGVMFNLCHWMRTDPDRDLKPVLEQAKPWLMAVSLSGSDKPEDVRSGTGNWIQPLDKGSYDITELTTLLNQIGFTGIIGLQCYGIGGDAATHLKQSMEKWLNI